MIRISITIALLMQYSIAWSWSDPVDLGIDFADDVNPHACRACVEPSCLVWESDVHGNWDIMSRFIGWEEYTDTFHVTVDTNTDINASVAFDYQRDYFWCVWQSDRTGNWEIFASYGDSLNGWSVPVQLSTDTLDDFNPAVYVNLDTVWVIWNGAWGIGTVYFDGNTWSSPRYIHSSWYDTRPCINGHYDHPLAVWSFESNIYYSECAGTTWTYPQQITDDDRSKSPEICTEIYLWDNHSYGAWIVWQCSLSVGNWELYSTDRDVFTNHTQLTNNNYNDITPNPLVYLALGDVPPITAYCSDSAGNNDIYAYWMGWGTEPIDTAIGSDTDPVLTQSGLHLWALWQTDRNGEWDIYGRFIDMNSVEEYAGDNLQAYTDLFVSPNPFCEYTTVFWKIRNSSQKILTIYDVAGRERQHFYLSASWGTINWNGTDKYNVPLSPGIYFIEIDDRITQKVILVR